MRKKKFLFISILLLAAVLLSGCTGATAWPGLSATDEVAYLAHTTAVFAIDMKTHQELWTFSGEKAGFSLFNTNPSMFISNPVVLTDGLVVILDSSNKHVMYAVDPNDFNAADSKPTPTIKWKFDQAGGLWIAPPLEVDGRIFAPNSDGNVYVLDLNDGKSVKEAAEVIQISKPGEKTDARLWAQPVTDGERLFITSLDKSVVAVDLATSEILWRADLGGAVPGGVALGGDGMLYVGSLAKQLERFDPLTGDHQSVVDTKGWIWGTPVADGDNLYFADVDGYFYSFNTAEQKLNWEPVQPDGSITANPLVVDEKVLVATESGGVYSIGADGKVDLWFQGDAKSKAYTTPVLADGSVLVAYLDSDYYLVALDNDGDALWKFPPGK